ncbi:unnamed protein product [Rotaria sordida]|uniref:Uncharacterized protein n=1 Tax=Rotaria sordida TaxID=392033 RepID=A0A815RR62_9BILA|nr:unnamed protein product [Rotaria sordida]CAF1480705.1 unnamed protein product [Rotaria sordida]
MSLRRSYSKESRSRYARSSSFSNDHSSSSYHHRPLSFRLIERDRSLPPLGFDCNDDQYSFERRSKQVRDDFQRRSKKFRDDFERRLRCRFDDDDFGRRLRCPFNDDDFDRRFRLGFHDDFDRRLRCGFHDSVFDDPFFKSNIGNSSLGFGRNIPINYQTNNNSISTGRRIPIQYRPSPMTNRHEKVCKQISVNTDGTSNSFQRNNDYFDRRENRFSTNDWTPRQESPTRKRATMTLVVRPPRIQYSDASYQQRTMSTPTYTSSNITNYY